MKAGCDAMAPRASRSMFRNFGSLRAMSYLFLGVVTVVEMALNFARLYSDSGFYLLAATGASSGGGLYVEMRFMLPHLVGFLNRALPFIGLSSAFGLWNCLFWGAGVVVAYQAGKILSDRNGGFLLALSFTTSVPILAYGAAVLPDVTAYFFAGLALLLALRTSPSRLRSAVEGAVLAVGPFFHFSAFLGLAFALANRLRHRQGLWTLLGVLPFLGAGVYVAFAIGLPVLAQLALSIGQSRIQGVGSGVLVSRGGTSLPRGLVQTFFVFAPIQFQLDRLYSMLLSFLTSDGMAAEYLWLAVLVIVGFWKSPRKGLLAAYCVTLAIFPVLYAPVFIERYLFTLWLFFLPVIVIGVRTLARIPAFVMGALLSKPGMRRVGILTNPDFYAIIFFLVQGISNTIAITYAFHLFPPIV